MISLNDIVWSEETDNKKIENAIPINCMAFNCAYHPQIIYEQSTVGGCPEKILTIFDCLRGVLSCNVL